MYVVLISLRVCFFAKRVHVLVKDFKDYQSLLSCRDYQSLLPLLFQDYQSLLYFSKSIKVCCLAETINIFFPLHFKDFSVFCQDYQQNQPSPQTSPNPQNKTSFIQHHSFSVFLFFFILFFLKHLKAF